MFASTRSGRRPMRVYYNLPSKSEHGRKMTGHITPYRHWMWKQNELWRNVHEAQFEHLRKVYKRQWLESFRVNADEYIYKYNITKSAQLAQWENEMNAQERKRREAQQMAQGRQGLRQKHLDLLREYHERQFFYWYERASERLQYMNLIKYVPQEGIHEHIEKELNKYVAGKQDPYPLNFVGQMPLLEDSDGNVMEVPEGLMANHAAENTASTATTYTPPHSTAVAEDKLLTMLVSAREEELEWARETDQQAFSSTLNDLDREAEEVEDAAKVPLSMEETDEQRDISRRAYIGRGKTGSKSIFRRPRMDDGGGEGEGKPATSDSAPPAERTKRRKQTAARTRQEEQDRALAQLSSRALKSEGPAAGKSGGRIRERVILPTREALMQNAALRQGSTTHARVRTQDIVDEKFGRGKYKKKDGKTDGDEDV